MGVANTMGADGLDVTGPFRALGTASFKAGAIAAAAIAGVLPGTQAGHFWGRGVELFGPTTAVAALTKNLPPEAYGAETLLRLDAWTDVIASGADRTIHVDLQKSTGAGAYASILSATLAFDNTSPAFTAVTTTGFTSAALVAGDKLRIVVTVAGSAGNQATGLSVSLYSDVTR